MKRAYFGLMLTLGLALIGCQSPSPTPAPMEQSTVGQPKVIVNYGHLKISQEADLAIAVNFKQKKYGVQAATMRADIQSVRVTVTGPNLAAPLSETVTRAQFNQGMAVFNFTNLPPGQVDVLVEALDLNGNVITSATGTAEIIKGQIAQLTLDCELTTGDLIVVFRCDDCVPTSAASPTATPVATASPSPTPTPSSTSTPTPIPTSTSTPLPPPCTNCAILGPDKVQPYSNSPDGKSDFWLILDLNFPQPKTIKSIALTGLDNPSDWQSNQVSFRHILGVFDSNYQPLFPAFTDILGTFSGKVTFNLYGSEAGVYIPGNRYQLTVYFSDGSTTTKIYTAN